MSATAKDTYTVERNYFDSAAYAARALSSSSALAAVIDHTLLKPDASDKEVRKLCEEAAAYRFACAMVNPAWVALAHSALAGTGIAVGVVIGFPLGANTTATKRAEALEMIKLGAHELDMVVHVGMLRSGMNAQFEQDIRSVAEVVHEAGAILKVILETCLLTMEEKLRASQMAIAAGTDFLKTSTGFSAHGATVEDLVLLRGVAGARCGVKASGGIRTLADARAMLEAGASRIGASAGVKILSELTSEQ
jgi:deoxyribose-phosphate aldolase